MMSIHPDMEAWKRRFGFLLIAALATLMLTGAKEVTHEWRRHHDHLEDINYRAWSWLGTAEESVTADGKELLGQAALGPNRDNARVLAPDGLFLLQACARPAPKP